MGVVNWFLPRVAEMHMPLKDVSDALSLAQGLPAVKVVGAAYQWMMVENKNKSMKKNEIHKKILL